MPSAEPLDPEVLAALEAIDATLYGDPVDPEFAEIAELSLMLREERAEPSDAWVAGMDRRVADRFAPAARASKGRLRLWSLPAMSLAAGVVVAVVVVALVLGSHGPAAHDGAPLHMTSTSAASSAAGSAGSSSAGSSGSASRAVAPRDTAAPAPRHSPARRDVTQSATLSLRASAGRIDPVAQEVFDVIGAEHGIVMSSHVTDTAGAPGFAQFQLRVPSGRLEATLRRLSSLRAARVISREDSSADITASVNGAASRLAIAQALHRSLLRRLAAAVTSTEADHIQTQLSRNAAAIAGDQAALARLHGRVTDSTISVQVTAPPAPPRHRRHHSGGASSTLGSGLHDAGQVLVAVAAGALVVLAVLVPLGVLAAIAAWVWALTLRRRREATLGPQH